MSEIVIEEIQHQETNVLSPGNRLRIARETLTLSVHDIARQMHLRPEIIEEIESDNYDSLGRGAVFLRGYLRGYAKLVNESADEIIEIYNALYPEEIVVVARSIPQTKTRPSNAKPSRPMRWVNTLLVIGLVSLVGIWWHNQKPTHSVIKLQTPTETEEAVVGDTAEKSKAPHSLETIHKENSLVVDNPKVEPQEEDTHFTKKYHQSFNLN